MKELPLGDISKLLDASFEVANYVASFPHVFIDADPDKMFFRRDGGKVVAFCALSDLQFLYQHNIFRAGCIGSVATEKSMRGKGFATSVLNEAENEARARGLDFLILFSQEKRVYEKLGFVEASFDDLSVLDSTLMDALKPACDDVEYKTYSELNQLPADVAAQVWRCLAKGSLAGEALLPYSRFVKLLQLPLTELHLLKRNEKICALCFVGRGADYQNVCHAFAFENERDVCGLLKNIFATRKTLLVSFGAIRSRLPGFSKIKFQSQTTLMVKSLSDKISTQVLKNVFDIGELSVSSLSSS